MRPELKPDFDKMGHSLGALLVRYSGERRLVYGGWSTASGTPITHEQCVQLCREMVAKLRTAWGASEGHVVQLVVNHDGSLSRMGYLCCLEYFAESMKTLHGVAHASP